jgi:hypothetical protein
MSTPLSPLCLPPHTHARTLWCSRGCMILQREQHHIVALMPRHYRQTSLHYEGSSIILQTGKHHILVLKVWCYRWSAFLFYQWYKLCPFNGFFCSLSLNGHIQRSCEVQVQYVQCYMLRTLLAMEHKQQDENRVRKIIAIIINFCNESNWDCFSLWNMLHMQWQKSSVQWLMFTDSWSPQ